MATVHPAYSYGAFGQHELPVHSADDLASRQQKMLQQRQRQLALKRQRELSKSFNGAGVTAQEVESPVDGSPISNKAVGWGKAVQGSGFGAEKLPLSDVSGLVRILVPSANGESPHIFSPRCLPTHGPSSDTTVTDAGSVAKVGDAISNSHHLEHPSDSSRQDMPSERMAEDAWDSQSESKSSEKSRSRSFWRPWGPKRTNVGTIVEERRVTVVPADAKDIEENSSVDRAATPYQAEETALEESFASDISSIPGITDSGDFGHDHNLDHVIPTLPSEDIEIIGKDHDDSADSGIEQTINEWKTQEKEKESPQEKRSRLNRFIPTAPKFWRAPKVDLRPGNSVTHTLVTPVDTSALTVDALDLD